MAPSPGSCFFLEGEGSATGSGATLTQLPRVMAWIKRWRERVSEADDATRKDDRNMRQKTVCANAEPPASPACGPLLLKVCYGVFRKLMRVCVVGRWMA